MPRKRHCTDPPFSLGIACGEVGSVQSRSRAIAPYVSARSRLDGAAALLLEAKPLESIGGRIVHR
jgi:hypothetical protein